MVQALCAWTPVAFIAQDTPAAAEWLPLGKAPLEPPFFDRLVRRRRARTAGVPPIRTSWELLGDVAARRPTLSPSGAIFHVSRCGSTVLSNVLAAVPQHLVISEAGAVNAVVGAWDADHPPEEPRRWLIDLIAALGHRRLGVEQRYFIKFSSWNVRHLRAIRRALPGLRSVFVYRDPIEVMVSVLNDPTGWMELSARAPVLAARRFGIPPERAIGIGREEFCARALASLFEAALADDGSDMLLVDYRQLRESLPEVLTFLGIDVSAGDQARMTAATRVYAKDAAGARVFEDDSAHKQREAPALVRRLAAHWVMSHYARLEARRARQTIERGRMAAGPGPPLARC